MVSRLSQMQARFQQKQMQEKEEKLLRLYENQQQRAFDRVNRNSAGSNTSATSTTSISQGGKVRQMFDERRQKAGIDRSYPLEPLQNSKNGHTRGNSLDRYKNEINSKTIVRSMNAKRDVSNIKKSLGNKNIKTRSNYINKNEDENYEEKSYDDNDHVKNRSFIINKTYKQKELNLLMNNFKIDDNIDDEEFPDVDIDEFDEPTTKIDNSINEKSLNQSNVISKSAANQKTNLKNNSKKNLNGPQALIKKQILQPNNNGTSRLHNNSSITRSPASVKNIKSELSSNMSKRGSDISRTPAVRPSSKRSGRDSTSAVVRDDLDECRFCNRRFAADRLAIHEDICAKTAKKKRKAYDATKHRVQGTELEPFTRKPSKAPASKVSQQQQSKKGNWRQKHEEFISAIRAAKMAQAHVAAGGKLSDLPPPPPSSNPDYVQCPHCGRRFNESAAARHIPKCATFEFNKPKAGAKNIPNRTSYR